MDLNFNNNGNIQTFLEKSHSVDMCFLKREDTTHSVVISQSFPASVHAVNQSHKLLWKLDRSDFGEEFKPRGVLVLLKFY